MPRGIGINTTGDEVTDSAPLDRPLSSERAAPSRIDQANSLAILAAVAPANAPVPAIDRDSEARAVAEVAVATVVATTIPAVATVMMTHVAVVIGLHGRPSCQDAYDGHQSKNQKAFHESPFQGREEPTPTGRKLSSVVEALEENDTGTGSAAGFDSRESSRNTFNRSD